MAKSKIKNKLDAEHKELIVKMLAAYYAPKEIIKYLNDNYGIKIDPSNVTYYKNNKREDIREARKNFLNDLEILPVSDKAHRILERQNLIKDLKKRLWNPIYSAKTGEIIKYEGVHHIINKILDSVQNELEPIKHSLTDIKGKEDLLAKYIQRGEELAEIYHKKLHSKSNNSDNV